MTTPETDENHRQRRADPERSGPNRQGANVFLDNASDTVTAVFNAYRVLADHLRLGEATARERGPFHGGANGGASGGASSGASGSNGAPPWAAMTGIPIQLFQAWAQMLATWADMTMIPNAGDSIRQMTKMAEAMWAMLGVVAPPASGAANEPLAPAKLHVVVELHSQQTTTVEVEFDPAKDCRPCMQNLHALRGDAPPLTGYSLDYDAASGRLALQLAVPPNQAKGNYSGIIFDDRDDRPCGTVRVRVGDA